MRFDFDSEDRTPLYRQLADKLHFAITTGKLKPGERLPSLRALARENALALNTASHALKELEQRGVVEPRNRSAYVVAGAGSEAETPGRYERRGVSSKKEEVHAVVERMERGIFPGAFCKVTEDYLTRNPSLCNVIHADGSGTKSTLAYLHYRETGGTEAFRGIAQDSIVMNLDDLLCIGAVSNILISSTINRNARAIPGEALAALIEGTEECLRTLREHGVDIRAGGGETADVGDLTPTCTVDTCAVATLRKEAVLTNEGIGPGLSIVGLSSFGRASYESAENSGIGSNGLTSARHDLLAPYYREHYPETFDPGTQKELVYCGPYRLEDPLPDSSLSVGEALLSPTRTYAPIVAALLRGQREAVRGLVHCSGGGQTKCLRFGRGVHYIKDNLFEPPALFRAIQEHSQTPWKEMYQVFNMGHRMEVICPPECAGEIIETAKGFGVDARVIGRTEASGREDGTNHLSLTHAGTTLEYAL